MTFMECGAYNQAWAQVHMFPEQTVQAHMDLNGNVLHPIHWGTFNLALHPWYEPMERLTACAKANNIKISTPIVGETTFFGKELPLARWWQPVMVQNQTSKKSIKHHGSINNEAEKMVLNSITDRKGRAAVVAGSSSGIGFETDSAPRKLMANTRPYG